MKHLTLLFAVLMSAGLPPAAAAPLDNHANSRVDYQRARYQAKRRCAELVSLTTTAFTVVSAKNEDGVCRVSGVVPSEIRFELNLPDAWNGRMLMNGNGGLAGQPPEGPRHTAWRARVKPFNFATVYSDTGHDNRVEPGATFAHNNLHKLIDYGYRGTHLTNVAAREIIRFYYRRAPSYSYFTGCSNGGRQALMAAQRFPEDFDGILAGAPANDFTGLKFSQAHRMKAFNSAPLSLPQVRTLGNIIYAKCDALDGLSDGLLSDPRTCPFSPQDLPLCEDGDHLPEDCFSHAQIEALEQFYAPVKVAGEVVYPPFPVGSEMEGPQGRYLFPGWMPWVINIQGRPLLDALGSEFFRYIVFTKDRPDMQWTEYNFAHAPDNLAYTRAIVDAVDPDLGRFKAAGGKLLSYFGWADPDINPLSTIDYFEQVQETVSGADEFYQLYMVPGMFHCAGGPGPSHFDAMTPLIEWVEKGIRPESIAAEHRRDGEVRFSRPLCPYPQRAMLTGEDATTADSFTCSNP